jgi:hypothetical protein
MLCRDESNKTSHQIFLILMRKITQVIDLFFLEKNFVCSLFLVVEESHWQPPRKKKELVVFVCCAVANSD